jgi:hypothetical protein
MKTITRVILAAVLFVCFFFIWSVITDSITDKRNRPVSIQDINKFNAKEMGIFQACLIENKKSHASTFVTYQQFNWAVEERKKLLADTKIFQAQSNALKEREACMCDNPTGLNCAKKGKQKLICNQAANVRDS